MYFGHYMMLDILDMYLCDNNLARRRSLILHRSYIPNLNTWKDRRISRNHKKYVTNTKTTFFDLDKVLMPVYDNCHWTLYVIFPRRKHIVFYDTLKYPEPKSLLVDDIFDYIADEAAEVSKEFKRSEWSYYRAEVINQGNGLDCGFCVIKYALIVLHDLPLDLKVTTTVRILNLAVT